MCGRREPILRIGREFGRWRGYWSNILTYLNDGPAVCILHIDLAPILVALCRVGSLRGTWSL